MSTKAPTSGGTGGSQEPNKSQHGVMIQIKKRESYLKLDLGLSNIDVATAAAGNLLCLGNLVPYGLYT